MKKEETLVLMVVLSVNCPSLPWGLAGSHIKNTFQAPRLQLVLFPVVNVYVFLECLGLRLLGCFMSSEQCINVERRTALTVNDVITGLRRMALMVNGFLTVRVEWT